LTENAGMKNVLSKDAKVENTGPKLWVENAGLA